MSWSEKARKTIILEDFKSPDGVWVSSYNVNSEMVYTQHQTRSWVLWANISKRCNLKGVSNARNSCYLNTENYFNSHQVFAEWCSKEYGYHMKDSSGKFWNIDKDILGGVVAGYREDSCMFIPQEVNKFFTQRAAGRGDYPLGVSWRKRDNKFVARCSTNSTEGHLGYFTDPMEAHKAWQMRKVELMVEMIDKYSEHVKLVAGLSTIICNVQEDINSGLETKNLLLGKSK